MVDHLECNLLVSPALAITLLPSPSPQSQAGRGKGPLSLDGARPLRMVIAGDGPSREDLEAYATRHSLPVVFLGNLPNKELPQLCAAQTRPRAPSPSERVAARRPSMWSSMSTPFLIWQVPRG